MIKSYRIMTLCGHPLHCGYNECHFIRFRQKSWQVHNQIILWQCLYSSFDGLTHWGRVTHICVGKLTIIGSDNGLSPERRQAIIWTNAGILLIGPLGTNLSESLIEIQAFALTTIRLKMSSAKCCSFRLGINVLTEGVIISYCITMYIAAKVNMR